MTKFHVVTFSCFRGRLTLTLETLRLTFMADYQTQTMNRVINSTISCMYKDVMSNLCIKIEVQVTYLAFEQR